jgi:hypothetical protein
MPKYTDIIEMVRDAAGEAEGSRSTRLRHPDNQRNKMGKPPNNGAPQKHDTYLIAVWHGPMRYSFFIEVGDNRYSIPAHEAQTMLDREY